jgi:hypothetical protein
MRTRSGRYSNWNQIVGVWSPSLVVSVSTVCVMTSVRRRRRQRFVRYAAHLAPITVLASGAAALVAGGWWPVAGTAAAVAISMVLAAIVLRLDRRLRIDVAALRAKLAAEYGSEQARHSGEHRSFSNHMVSLLDAASVRISVLRRRVDSLEREVATTRFLQATPSAPPVSTELEMLPASAAEWTDIWPELAEAPTVVDLIKWDERARSELLSEGIDEADTGDETEQRRSA